MEVVPVATACMWVAKELWDRRWKTGKRLSFKEKVMVISCLIRYFSIVLQKQETSYNEKNAKILIPLIHSLTQNKISGYAFNDTGQPIPHGVDEEDIALCETSDEEEYDTCVSDETIEQIAQLVAACKEFKLKIPEHFGEGESQNVQITHVPSSDIINA
jgi:hypothetical protein